MRAYTGQTDADEREESEGLLKRNEVKALVATSALGMGFDKPDLGFVLHLGAPSSPVAYYQQVGRAGRASESADVLLLPGTEDRDIWHYFATASMPDQDRAERVIEALSDVPLSTPALEAMVDIRRSPLELLLKVLDVDGAVRRVQGGWIATGEPWVYDAERYRRISAARMAEQQHMIDYEQTDGCRMEFLQRSLDDETAVPCGRCDNCAGVWYPSEVARQAAESAAGALDRVGVPIEPRAMWPTGADRLGVPVKGRIAPGERAGEGRALARLTDLGWGGTLRELFAAGSPDAPVPPQVLAACVRVLADWSWPERPVAVVVDAVALATDARRVARARARRGRSASVPRLARLRERRSDRPARRQQRLPARRALGSLHRRRSRRAARYRAARRRPSRQPLDPDGCGPRAARSRGDRGAAVRARDSRVICLTCTTSVQVRYH